jgi:hypothetical protein
MKRCGAGGGIAAWIHRHDYKDVRPSCLKPKQRYQIKIILTVQVDFCLAWTHYFDYEDAKPDCLKPKQRY